MPIEQVILEALRAFADDVTAKSTALTAGEPEDQLRGPFETLLKAIGKAMALDVVSTGEAPLPGRLGRPDYAVHVAGPLTGYVELKAPGTGADTGRFTGRNREQARRFAAIPNLLYCDGGEWGLYRDGEPARPMVRLSGNVAARGGRAVAPQDAEALHRLLADFFQWSPQIPMRRETGTRRRVVDLKAFAAMLAPLCRMLRDDVTDALTDPRSPLVQLARDWRQSLFADASDEQFADAYAQTVTFALLLARSEGADPLDSYSASRTLNDRHALLARVLAALTDFQVKKEMSASLDLLVRVIAEVPTAALKSAGGQDPWLFFYEDFLAAYDPRLRRDAGAYYTPVEVVRAQVRLIDDLLTNRLGKALGFADPGVITLDPAVGTGTYLLGVIDHALAKVQERQGPGAVPGQASALANNIYGFEIMVGPFAVSELRVAGALADRGATLPSDGTHIYLTDTLESPQATPPQLPLFFRPIADQHRRAVQVKAQVPVIVCLGNPPYDRHEAADEANKARTGHWVRWGDDDKGTGAIFKDFLDPAIAAGRGKFVTGLYNLYVYFWRWALWKVFEGKSAAGPGVVSFITASSYLDGDAFWGMREHMRRVCDEIWVLDLGGEGRGTRRSENVFAIQTPVAIAVAVRHGKARKSAPAKVHYAAIPDGSRNEKLKALDGVANFASLTWQDCPNEWHAPFRPAGVGTYFSWPLLKDLFPWQQPGVKTHRTWLIAPSEELLRSRWRLLLAAADRREAFKENGERKIEDAPAVAITPKASATPIARLSSRAHVPPVHRYGFRSLDRQHILADIRLMTRPRPVLWHLHGSPDSSRQMYLSTLLNHPLASGPGAMACASIPDMHHFRGSYGGKDIIPLYRDPAGKEPNVLSGLLVVLGKAYGRKVTAEDFLAYVYGVLAQPAFTERFADELGTRQLRVPLTRDAELFFKVRDAGAKLLWLHTYGQRFVPKGRHAGQVPKGAGRCERAVPAEQADYPEKFSYNERTGTLFVGSGEFRPVGPEVYNFEVSGLKVVHSWLGYRMKRPKGKKSSPLDEITPATLGGWPSEFTTELLELLSVLETTVAEYPAMARLLSAVIDGPCFRADELPDVPDAARKPPARTGRKELFDDSPDD